ncbi:MAG: hypothetical protein WCC96_14620, partial [Rhodomicrobium sp.]
PANRSSTLILLSRLAADSVVMYVGHNRVAIRSGETIAEAKVALCLDKTVPKLHRLLIMRVGCTYE